MIKKLILLVCVFVLIADISFATRTTRKEITCPLCNTRFTASVVLSTNNFGGTDHDLCPHAVGGSPLSSYIWGCPYCNFCGYSSDFSKSYTEEEKAKLSGWLKEKYPPTIEKPVQEETKEDDESNYNRNQYSYNSLPSFKRYEIAAELAKLNNKTNYEIGQLYLKATWCSRAHTMADKDGKSIDDVKLERLIEGRDNPIIREEFEKVYSRLNHVEAETTSMADLFLKIADNIEKKNIENEEQKLMTYCTMAANLRSSGENTKAERFIKKAEECQNSDKLSVLFEGLRNSIKLERAYQKRVIEFLSASLNDNLNEMQKLEVNLLLGEMNRRTENYDEAVKYYKYLLDNHVNLPEHFMKTVIFAYENMGIKDESFIKTMDIIERNRITAYFMKLGMDPYDNEAAFYLRFSPRRDIIYPELVQTINELTNKDKTYEATISKLNPEMINSIMNNVILAMSDQTKEAALFQYELLDKGYDERQLLRNLKALAFYLPAEKFIKRLKEAKTRDQIEEYITFLKIIRNKESFEAIMTKAEELLSDQHLRNLGNDNEEENRLTDAYETLLDSLHMFRGKRTIDFLVKVSESSLKIYNELKNEMPEGKKPNHYLLEIYTKAGIALETMFFKHFGYSRVFSRKLEPHQFETEILHNNDSRYEIPLNNFKKWYAEHGKDDYQKIIYSGFKEFGYDILPVSDPKKLYDLFYGLHDQFRPARVQCYKELVRRTGIMNHPEAGLSCEFHDRESEEEMSGFYSKWLDENISKLVYDEKAKKFIIKK